MSTYEGRDLNEILTMSMIHFIGTLKEPTRSLLKRADVDLVPATLIELFGRKTEFRSMKEDFWRVALQQLDWATILQSVS